MTAKTTNPIAAEALALPIEFDFEGNTYAVLPTAEWPFEAIESFESGHLAAYLKHVLATPEDYQRFRDTKPTVGKTGSFIQALQKANGIQGN